MGQIQRREPSGSSLSSRERLSPHGQSVLVAPTVGWIGAKKKKKAKRNVFSLRSLLSPSARSFWLAGSKASLKSLFCVFSWYFASTVALLLASCFTSFHCGGETLTKPGVVIRGAELSSQRFTGNYVDVGSALETLFFTITSASICCYEHYVVLSQCHFIVGVRAVVSFKYRRNCF